MAKMNSNFPCRIVKPGVAPSMGVFFTDAFIATSSTTAVRAGIEPCLSLLMSAAVFSELTHAQNGAMLTDFAKRTRLSPELILLPSFKRLDHQFLRQILEGLVVHSIDGQLQTNLVMFRLLDLANGGESLFN